MIRKSIASAISAALLMLLAAGATNAAIITYTDRAAFDAAIADIANTSQVIEDFEGFTGQDDSTVGDVISNGSTYNGITYNLTAASGFELGIDGAGDADGTLNTLGATNNSGESVGRFAPDEFVSFSFAASHAFGLNLITGGNFDLIADELTIKFAGATLGNSVGQAVDIGGSAGKILFLGIVDTDTTFESATATFKNPDPDVVIGTLDNVTRTVRDQVTDPGPDPVPVPAALPLLVLGFGAMALARRRREA